MPVFGTRRGIGKSMNEGFAKFLIRMIGFVFVPVLTLYFIAGFVHWMGQYWFNNGFAVARWGMKKRE